MNFRTTATLIGLLAVLTIVLLFVRSRGGGDDDEFDRIVEEPKLVALEASGVNRVVVASSDNEKLVLEKSGADWRIAEPVSAAADTFAVDSLVRAITGMRSSGEVEVDAQNRESVGVDTPRYTVELFAADGKSATVNIGNRSAVGGNAYVSLPKENKTYVVGDDVLTQLDKPFTSYRQQKLVTASAADLKQIEITRPDGRLVLHKTGTEWQVVEPRQMPAESSEVSDLTWAITGLSATEFVEESDIPAPLRPNSASNLTVAFSTQAPATQPAATQPAMTAIRFGGYDNILKKNVYVATSDGLLAKVPATSLETFRSKTALDLRDRRVLDVTPANVSSISIVSENLPTTQPSATQPASRTEVVIERKKQQLAMGPAVPPTQPTTQPATQPALPPSDWTIASASPPVDASQAEIEGLLNQFNPLRADKYLDGPMPTTQPTARYVVTINESSAGGANTAQHQIRLHDPGDARAMIGEYNGLVFEVPRTLVQNLTQDLTNKPVEEAPEPPSGFPSLPPGHP